MIACPPDAFLSELLAGAASESDLPAFDSHLSGCAQCQERLGRLSDSSALSDLRAEADGRPAEYPFLQSSNRPGYIGRLGRFHVECEVGRGGMGVVFRAWDDTLGRPVALKILRAGRDDPGGAARFALEARAAARVVHDHLVPVLSVEETVDGRAVLVLPYINGPCLRDRVRAERELHPREAASIVCQAASGLAAAHAAGIIHRDVKPSNIMLDGSDGRAKLTDFGLARFVEREESLTASGAVAGTAEYMAPEHAADPRAAGPAADVYSFGCTLYECLMGVVPFRGTLLEVLERHRSEEPVPPRKLSARVPVDLQTICLKCLEKEPSRRYANAAELEADLRRYLAGEPVKARPIGRLRRSLRWTRRNPLPVAVVAVSVVGAIAAGSGWRQAAIKSAEASQNAVAAGERATEAEQARNEAREKATLANERTALALSSITSLIGKAQSLADNAPGTLKLKKELAEVARADLQKLSSSAAAVVGADRATVQAHLKLGDALNLLGQTDDALIEWDRARDVAEKLLASDPADTANRLDWASAHSKLAFASNRLARRKNAIEHYTAAIESLEPLCREQADNRTARQALALALLGRGDIARDSGDGVTARSYTERAADLFEQLTMADPASDAFRNNAYYTRSRLGYTCLYPFQESALAVGHFRLALKTATEQHKRNPDDPTWARNHRIALLDLGCGLQRAADYSAAEEAINQAIPLIVKASASEPENAQLLRDHASTLAHLAWVRVGQSRWEDAESLILKANDLLEQVAGRAKSPAMVAQDLPGNLYLLFLLSAQQSHYKAAAEQLDRWGREVGKLMAGAGVSKIVIATTLQRLQPILAALRQLETAADNTKPKLTPPAVSAETAKWISIMQLYARKSVENDPVARSTELLQRYHGDPAVLSCHAMMLGRVARTTSDPAKREQFVLDGVKALIASLKADRTILDTVHLNPDFDRIRTHPSFISQLRNLIEGH